MPSPTLENDRPRFGGGSMLRRKLRGAAFLVTCALSQVSHAQPDDTATATPAKSADAAPAASAPSAATSDPSALPASNRAAQPQTAPTQTAQPQSVSPGAPPGSDAPPAAPSEVNATEMVAALQRARQQLAKQSEGRAETEAQAYCKHVRAEQQSNTALLRSPWLAARGSTLQSGELSGPADAVSPRLRLGVGFSVSDWLRADLLDEQAERSCDLYRAEVELRETDYELDAITLDGWMEKLAVLDAALKDASSKLAQSERALQSGERTVTTHLTLLTAYQRLLEASTEARTRVAQLAVAEPPAPQLRNSLMTLKQSVVELENVQGRLRRNQALTFSIEGGYDEIVGADQVVPAYGQVSITFRPGYFWQADADEQSAHARAEAATARATRAQTSLRRALLLLEAQKAPMGIEAARLRSLVSTLEQQQNVLSQIQNSQALEVAERLWFELQLRRAELAQIEASLRAIERWAQQFGAQ